MRAAKRKACFRGIAPAVVIIVAADIGREFRLIAKLLFEGIVEEFMECLRVRLPRHRERREEKQHQKGVAAHICFSKKSEERFYRKRCARRTTEASLWDSQIRELLAHAPRPRPCSRTSIRSIGQSGGAPARRRG